MFSSEVNVHSGSKNVNVSNLYHYTVSCFHTHKPIRHCIIINYITLEVVTQWLTHFGYEADYLISFYITEQLRVKGVAQGPSGCSNLPISGPTS